MGNTLRMRFGACATWVALCACACIALGTSCPAELTPDGLGAANDALLGETVTGDGGGSPTEGDTGQTDGTTSPAPALPGDMDGDGVLGQSDVDAFVAAYEVAFGASAGDPDFNAALDIDGDGQITFADLQAFQAALDGAGQ